ncbi:hypothetical protein E2562_009035 [Oryza meyeriana var. granulata]|uniref:Uncharacterized protein n=1 Tax=Oryza meyeriana var. granulata TaxID=110450 RepID=A0A6G1CZY3_9ORYZ|nr:hypothetical protein E2562_009035 [Oryza meyeriana var. granulata]
MGGLLYGLRTASVGEPATGDFEIRLESICYIWFGSHLGYFEDTIRGRISYGTITGFSGVAVGIIVAAVDLVKTCVFLL